MRSLRLTKAAFNQPVVTITMTALVMSVLLLLIIPSHSTSSASTASKPAQQQAQAALFTYWSVDDGLSSSVFLNNASGIELTVRPTLYNLSGKQLVINPITLGARRQITANIADWLNQNNADDSFKQGNLILNYEAENATLLGSQVVITKAASSLSFDVPVAMPTSFESSRLEGIWWRPNEASRYDLVLSNMQGSSVEVKVAVSGSHGLKDADFDITLAPHQTEVVNLEDNQGGFAAELGKMGTVSITHTGVPGAVVASGMLSEDKKGFSSRFVFEDPDASRSQTLAAA
ncbi:MAG: hypothetical protein ACRD63_09555, partial [Pyrinomonadaceae bacterium]